MSILDYIISKDNYREQQFIGVVSCLKLFRQFPPGMDIKAQKKFVKQYKSKLDKLGYIFK